jgi:hypothetical protein
MGLTTPPHKNKLLRNLHNDLGWISEMLDYDLSKRHGMMGVRGRTGRAEGRSRLEERFEGSQSSPRAVVLLLLLLLMMMMMMKEGESVTNKGNNTMQIPRLNFPVLIIRTRVCIYMYICVYL